jgi:hypothetical protein
LPSGESDGWRNQRASCANDTELTTNNKQYRDDFKFIVNKSLVLYLVAYFEILLQVYFCFLRFEKEKEQTVLTLFIGTL